MILIEYMCIGVIVTGGLCLAALAITATYLLIKENL